MKCELCKREARNVLCETCAEAIRRLVTLVKRADEGELALKARVGF